MASAEAPGPEFGPKLKFVFSTISRILFISPHTQHFHHNKMPNTCSFVVWCILFLWQAVSLLGHNEDLDLYQQKHHRVPQQRHQKPFTALNECWLQFANTSALLTNCLQEYIILFAQNNIRKKKEKVVFSVCYSPQVESYAAVAAFINTAYATHRHYNIKLLTTQQYDYFPEDRRWNKIASILDGFNSSSSSTTTTRQISSSNTIIMSEGWASDADILVAMDADVIITDFEQLDIIKIVNTYKKAHIIMSADAHDTANSGFMIVRNTKYAYGFLSTWYAARFSYDCDQHAFNALYDKLKLKNRHNKIKILPRGKMYYLLVGFNRIIISLLYRKRNCCCLLEIDCSMFQIIFINVSDFNFLGDINSDVPLTTTFIAGVSKVLHLFGLPNHVRRSIFTHAAHALSRTLAVCGGVFVVEGGDGIELLTFGVDAAPECSFSSGLNVSGQVIRSAMYVDVATRRKQLIDKIQNIRSDFTCHYLSIGMSEECKDATMGNDADTEDTSGVLFTKMKQLFQITSELCTGREQLMKWTSKLDEGGCHIIISQHNNAYYDTCIRYFEDNIQLTKELIRIPVTVFESVGIELLAEAQNSRLEMLLDYYADNDRDRGRDSDSVIEEEVVESGRDLLLTLKNLMELSSQQKVNLNPRSVMFRIAASNYNLAMFCLGAQRVGLAFEFSQEGLLTSVHFVSDDFRNFYSFISMHAALLSTQAYCFYLQGNHKDAIAMSTLAILYAKNLYQTVYTEKNIYCGELFDHYLKRIHIVESRLDALRDVAHNIETLSEDCHIELSTAQQDFIYDTLDVADRSN
jgi:hypothetical protein